MDWRSAIGTAKDLASGAIDAVRANDNDGKGCSACRDYPGTEKVKCPYCSKELNQ